ncbi:MAG: hypothetical protein ACYTEK_06010, partial [Planctomycetota bacterium]
MKDKMNCLKSFAERRPMRPGHLSFHLAGWLLVLACFTAPLAAKPLRIYIVTDLEGASGVYKFAQTREPGNP